MFLSGWLKIENPRAVSRDLTCKSVDRNKDGKVGTACALCAVGEIGGHDLTGLISPVFQGSVDLL